MHPSPYPTHPQPEPALHLLAGLWVASCPTCGFQLHHSPHPGPLRTPRRPPPLPRLPRGRLMPRITIHLGGREPGGQEQQGHPAGCAWHRGPGAPGHHLPQRSRRRAAGTG